MERFRPGPGFTSTSFDAFSAARKDDRQQRLDRYVEAKANGGLRWDNKPYSAMNIYQGAYRPLEVRRFEQRARPLAPSLR